jgi:hypothetical protein
MVSNPVIVAVDLLLFVPQQERPAFEPKHVNSANDATALIVKSRMLAVRAARK